MLDKETTKLIQSLLTVDCTPAKIEDFWLKSSLPQLLTMCPVCPKTKKIENIFRTATYKKQDFYFVKCECNSPIFTKNKTKTTIFVLFLDVSHLHSSWAPAKMVEEIAPAKVKAYNELLNLSKAAKIGNKDVEMTLADEDEFYRHLQMGKILTYRLPYDQKKLPYSVMVKTLPIRLASKISYGLQHNYHYFVQWDGLEYKNETWENEFVMNNFEAEIQKFVLKKIEKEHFVKNPGVNYEEIFTKKFPSPNHELLPYQEDGVKWILNQFNQKNDRNCIMADESGLGKRVQMVSFMQQLFTQQKIRGPFMIIAPDERQDLWLRELERWAPNLYAVKFYGNEVFRGYIRNIDFHYFPDTDSQVWKLNVLVVSFKTLQDEWKTFPKGGWKSIMIDDEKCHSPANFAKFEEFPDSQKILILRSKLESYPADLQKSFLEPGKKTALKKRPDVISDLPLNHFLMNRRADLVALELPVIEEYLVKLKMTNEQRDLYLQHMLAHRQLIKPLEDAKFSSQSVSPDIFTLLQSLRFICDFPSEDYRRCILGNFALTEAKINEEIVKVSNKLSTLERIVGRILAGNQSQKVTIFSDFSTMLDLIELIFSRKNLPYIRDCDQKTVSAQNFDKNRVFLVCSQMATSIYGAKLPATDYFIFLDSSLDIARELRTVVRGPIKKITAIRLVSKDTVEDQIFGLVKLRIKENQREMLKLKAGEFDSLVWSSAKNIIHDKDNNNNAKDFGLKDEQIDQILSQDTTLKTENRLECILMGFMYRTHDVVINPSTEIEVENPQTASNWKQLWSELDTFKPSSEIKEKLPVTPPAPKTFKPVDFAPISKNYVGQNFAALMNGMNIEKIPQVISNRGNDGILKFLQRGVAKSNDKYMIPEQGPNRTCGLTEGERSEFLKFVRRYGIDFETLPKLYELYVYPFIQPVIDVFW